MSPFEWVATGAMGVLLLILWRTVDGVLKLRTREAKNSSAGKAVLAKLAELEGELTRIPRNAADAGDLEELENKLRSVEKLYEMTRQQFSEHQAKVAERTTDLAQKLITREMAERIVNQVNAVTLDVTALKEWQAQVNNTEALESVLQPEHS